MTMLAFLPFPPFLPILPILPILPVPLRYRSNRTCTRARRGSEL
jgi:hypothetical protein